MAFEPAALDEEQYKALPEPLRAQFEPGDGGRYIQRDPGAGPADALKAERTNAEKLRRQVAEMEKRYANAPDPEKFAELQAKLQQIEDEKLKANGQHEELFQRQFKSLQEAKDAEIAARDAQLKDLSSQLEKVLIEDRGIAAVASVEGFDGEAPGNMDLLRLLLRATMRLHEGKPTPFEDGQPVLVEGRAMTLDEWVKQLPKTYPRFFKPSNGGGATNNAGRGGTPGSNPKPLKDWKPDEKSAFIREHGLDRWTDLVRTTYGNGTLPSGV